MTEPNDQPPVMRLTWIPAPSHPDDRVREVDIPLLPPEEREVFLFSEPDDDAEGEAQP